MVKVHANGISLTFPEVDLKGQQVSLDVVADQVLQRDQELHSFFQRILRLVKEANQVPLLICKNSTPRSTAANPSGALKELLSVSPPWQVCLVLAPLSALLSPRRHPPSSSSGSLAVSPSLHSSSPLLIGPSSGLCAVCCAVSLTPCLSGSLQSKTVNSVFTVAGKKEQQELKQELESPFCSLSPLFCHLSIFSYLIKAYNAQQQKNHFHT